MKASQSFDTFEEHWKNLLHQVDAIDPTNVGDVAEKAIALYEKALDEAESTLGN